MVRGMSKYPSGFWGWGVLGGSWVVISRAISRITIVIIHIRGLITSLITTHEPPSIGSFFGFWAFGFRPLLSQGHSLLDALTSFIPWLPIQTNSPPTQYRSLYGSLA